MKGSAMGAGEESVKGFLRGWAVQFFPILIGTRVSFPQKRNGGLSFAFSFQVLGHPLNHKNVALGRTWTCVL